MTKLMVLLLVLAASPALAAELQIGKEMVSRVDLLRAMLKFDKPLEGQGELSLKWTDSYGRAVAVLTEPVSVSGTMMPIALPLDRAVAMQNFLEAKLTVGRTTVSAGKTEFIVTPEPTMWDDYEIIMYYAYKPHQQMALRELGITAGKLSSGGTQQLDGGKVWYKYNYRFYCDQIGTAFYAAYHTPAYTPKQKMLQLAKAAYVKDRSSKKPFYRRPCLHDEQALAEAVDRLRTAVKMQQRYRPFFYAHTDEGGVADLVTAWDFCFDPRTLSAMRRWLIDQYGSLEAINDQWGTNFARLKDVMPFSTDEMMARKGDNFSPWADHRLFMNQAFADTLLAGTKAVEEVDPQAKVGLVGCQMPSAFGGYDYWLLSQVMTAIEPYNIGNNREIWRSLAPDKPAVTTAFGVGDMEVWRLWYQFLHGDRGIIIYDEKHSYLDAEGRPTETGAGIAPTYKELTGGLCKQLAHMQHVNDPIAIHYSQASITAHWMYEARPEGKYWLRRGSAAERKRSDFLRLRESSIKLIEDNLRQYDFVAYGQLESGDFDNMGTKVLILPQSIAMSKAECDAVRRFVQRGGTVIADCRTAVMDEHCKMLEEGQLDDLFGIKRKDLDFAPGSPGLAAVAGEEVSRLRLPAKLEQLRVAEPGIRAAQGAAAWYKDARGKPAFIVKRHGKGRTIYLNAVITNYHRWRLRPPEGQDLAGLVGQILGQAGAQRQYAVTTADGGHPHGVEVHPFVCGDLRVLALHRNYQLRVSELGPPEYHSQDALSGQLGLKVDLGGEYAVYDQRQGRFLGKKRVVTLDLAAHQPTVLSILPEPVKDLSIAVGSEAKRGDLITAKLELRGPTLGDYHAFRVVVLGEDGHEMTMLTQTLLAPRGKAQWQFPIALSDPPGTYTLRVRDVATGVQAEHKLSVR